VRGGRHVGNLGPQPGEAWAYRARQSDELVQVKVLRAGSQRPVRVLVHFADDRFEGRQEWVPPARLKVIWQNVDEFRLREQRASRVFEAGFPDDDGRTNAAERVVELLLDDAQVEIMYREAGAARISDPDAVASRLGLDVSQVAGHPLAFTERDATIVPWEVTELIAMTAARQSPVVVLEYVASEERKARREAIYGRWSRGGRRSSDYFFEPEACQEMDHIYDRPCREILRSWCDADAADRFDELAELRIEVRRVGDIAQAAIDVLRKAGREQEAVRLQRELGTTVAMLRDS
jgi:hypothetical protein